jgi:hypothetical protein
MVGVFLASLASFAVLGFAVAVIFAEFRHHWSQVLATFTDSPATMVTVDPTPPAARPAVVRREFRRSRPARALAA